MFITNLLLSVFSEINIKQKVTFTTSSESSLNLIDLKKTFRNLSTYSDIVATGHNFNRKITQGLGNLAF